MSDQQALPPQGIVHAFPEGTSVYDLNGVRVGTVSKQSQTANMLIVHTDLPFDQDIHVPLNTVQRSDAHGIYLSVTKDELQHEHSVVTRATTAAGEVELISQGVDVIEQTPDTRTQGVAVIEQNPNTATKGVDVIEQNPNTITKGTNTVE